MMPIQQAKSAASLLGLMVALTAIILATTTTNSAEARYLPTRADESDVEVLKDLIRGLIMQSNLEQLEARMMQQPQASRFYQQHHSPAATGSLPQQQLFQVERRSVEMPVGSDGDSLLRSTDGKPIKSDR